jgi:hypothetical protein
MFDRTAKFAFAIFASVVASAPLTTTSSDAAGAEDDCLSTPNSQTSQRGHWYYRIDRATNRHCWYLKEDDASSSQSAEPKSAPTVRPVSPKPAAQRLVADARAELPVQPRNEPSSRDRSVAAIAGDARTGEVNTNTNTKPQVAEARSTVIASRWLGQSDADPSANPTLLTSPTPLTGPMPTNSAPNSRMPSRNYPDTNVGAAPSLSAAPNLNAATNAGAAPLSQSLSPVASGQFAAPDWSSGTPPHSVQMLLAAMMGALGLAGLMGRAIFKFVGPRNPGGRKGSQRRRAIWKSIDKSGRRKSTIYPRAAAVPTRPDVPRDLDQDNDPDGRIAEFFTKMSHHAPT